jgi:hypothetical protein
VLGVGDTIEFAISLSHNYNSVKSGATTTVRDGESADEAQRRLEAFVTSVALSKLEELA